VVKQIGEFAFGVNGSEIKLADGIPDAVTDVSGTVSIARILRLRHENADKLRAHFFFSSRRRHTSYIGDWSSDVCSSDLLNTIYLADQMIRAGDAEIVMS